MVLPMQFSNKTDNVRLEINWASAEMFPRELMQNAIEAIETGKIPNGEITWGRRIVNDVPKLFILDNGRGMDADHLLNSLRKIGGSGDEKKLAIDANFGRGAKMTIMAAMKLGAVYTTCHKGKVSKAWLRWEDGVPGLHEWQTEDGEILHVLDVTENYPEDQRNHSWCEVLLMGNSMEHDTTECPFQEGKKEKVYWLTEILNRRYYDLERVGKVSVRISSSASRILRGMKYQPTVHETVADLEDFSIRYLLTEDVGGDRAKVQPQGYCAHGAIVYRNELYDFSNQMAWSQKARSAGVTFGSNRVVIQVHIRRGDYCKSEAQRRYLMIRDPSGVEEQLGLEFFAEDIKENMPQWLHDHIARSQPKEWERSAGHKKRIRDLMDQLQARIQLADLSEPGDKETEEAETGSGQRGGGEGDTDGGDGPNTTNETVVIGDGGRVAAKDDYRRRTPPEVMWLDRDEGDFQEVAHRVGRYQWDAHIVLANAVSEHLRKAVSVLMKGRPEELRADVIKKTKEEVEYLLVEHVMTTLTAKRNKHWGPDQIEAACCPEALTSGCNHVRIVQGASLRMRHHRQEVNDA